MRRLPEIQGFDPSRRFYSYILSANVIGVIRWSVRDALWLWHLEDRGGRPHGRSGACAALVTAYRELLRAEEALTTPSAEETA